MIFESTIKMETQNFDFYIFLKFFPFTFYLCNLMCIYACVFEFYPLNFSCFIHVENDFNRLSLHKRTIVVNLLPYLKRTR